MVPCTSCWTSRWNKASPTSIFSKSWAIPARRYGVTAPKCWCRTRYSCPWSTGRTGWQETGGPGPPTGRSQAGLSTPAWRPVDADALQGAGGAVYRASRLAAIPQQVAGLCAVLLWMENSDPEIGAFVDALQSVLNLPIYGGKRACRGDFSRLLSALHTPCPMTGRPKSLLHCFLCANQYIGISPHITGD